MEWVVYTKPIETLFSIRYQIYGCSITVGILSSFQDGSGVYWKRYLPQYVYNSIRFWMNGLLDLEQFNQLEVEYNFLCSLSNSKRQSALLLFKASDNQPNLFISFL